jgi:hypothetical protein
MFDDRWSRGLRRAIVVTVVALPFAPRLANAAVPRMPSGDGAQQLLQVGHDGARPRLPQLLR